MPLNVREEPTHAGAGTSLRMEAQGDTQGSSEQRCEIFTSTAPAMRFVAETDSFAAATDTLVGTTVKSPTTRATLSGWPKLHPGASSPAPSTLIVQAPPVDVKSSRFMGTVPTRMRPPGVESRPKRVPFGWTYATAAAMAVAEGS